MLKKLTFVFLLATYLGSYAQAMILFSPSVTYLEQSQDDGTNPEVDAKLTFIDLRLGYVFDFGLYIGGMYSLQDHDLLSDSSDSYLGPSIGYYNSGFLVVGTFYLYGEKDITNGSGKFTQVSGYQLDVSYSVPITPNFRIGPQLTFHNYKFDEFEVAGFSGPADFQFSGVTPYFNMTFEF